MNKRQQTGAEIKPTKMALCSRCENGIRETYWITEDESTREGICGYCGGLAVVRSCALFPKVNHAYRRRTGGGERRRAERTA